MNEKQKDKVIEMEWQIRYFEAEDKLQDYINNRREIS